MKSLHCSIIIKNIPKNIKIIPHEILQRLSHQTNTNDINGLQTSPPSKQPSLSQQNCGIK